MAHRSTRLDLNTASLDELTGVPGLSADLAQRVVAQRPFKKVKELLRVPGLELELYLLAEPHLRVGAPRRPRAARQAVGAAPISGDLSTAGQAKPAPRPPRPRRPRQAAPPTDAPAAGPAAPQPGPSIVLPRPRPASASVPRVRWSEPLEAPVITIEAEPEPLRPYVRPTPPAVSPMRAVVPLTTRVNALLFESYAGPRLVFALFSVTLLVLGWGVLTGLVHFGATPVGVPDPAPTSAATAMAEEAPSADVLATQVSAALAATLSAQATEVSPTAATALPSASATPTITFVSNSGLTNTGQQIFNETFVPPGYWSVGDNDLSERVIADNQLIIRMKVPGAIAWAVNGYAGDNFYYQGTLRMGACQLGDYAGLAFRVKDDDNLYLFGLSCDGRYRLIRRVGGEFQTLVDFTFTPEAIAGSNATNLLAVRADSQMMGLYINDQFLGQVDVGAAGPDSGLFGTFGKSANTPNLQVSFDDLSAWALEP